MARRGGSGDDTQRQILTLIRDFATERSQGERRVFDLKKRHQDLRLELEAATAALEGAKLSNEEALVGLNESEAELRIADASVIAQKERNRLLQEEVAKVGDDIAYLKDKGAAFRDEFTSTMLEFNRKIRKFQETVAHPVQMQENLGISSFNDAKTNKNAARCSGDGLKGLKDKIEYTNGQIAAMEQEYQEALREYDEVMQLVSCSERRAALVEKVTQEIQWLSELGEQTAEAEKHLAYLGAELKKRYTCPSCQLNNIGEIEGSLLTGDG